MKKRLQSLEKISELQSKLHDLNKWRLAEIEQKRQELEEIQRAMIEAIDRDAINQGALAAAASRRLRAIDRQIATTKAAYEAQSQKTRDQGARAKVAERLVQSADAEYRAQKERKDLGDLIERSIGRKPSSPA
jgi:hypothetical protein